MARKARPPADAPIDEPIAWHRDRPKRCACRLIRAEVLDVTRYAAAIDESLADVGRGLRVLLHRRLFAFRYCGKVIAGLSAASTGGSYCPVQRSDARSSR